MRKSFKIEAQILVESSENTDIDTKKLFELIRSTIEDENGFSGYWLFSRYETATENSPERTEELFP